ncbi:MAG TPA: TPM domain-containing protein [Burkholderiales bacterium]|nr:TPM domain-containing protein [Burkholderiales bacterium]
MVRLLKHALALPGSVARAFPASALSSIEKAIQESEKRHGGEIRFAVEAALDPVSVLKKESARERAVEVFAELGVWDTEQNNGVLLYLLLADHDVEIVADRGFNGKVSAVEWEGVCRAMEAHLKAGEYAEAICEGIARIGELVGRHFPAGAQDRNELPDRPVHRR